MSLVLILLVCFSALEIFLWLPPLWRWRKILVCGLIPIISLLSGLLVGSHFVVWTSLIFVASVYRLINLLRILENRLQSQQLYQVTQKTSYWLISWQLVIGGCAVANNHYFISVLHWLYGLGVGQLLVAIILVAATERHLRTTRPPTTVKSLTDHDLPTLSVLVPARNETDDLETCLQSLVDSDYPKLEIIVLDDCSQNKRTPAIIRDYAQNGVRFIGGQVSPQQWLAKNWAYQQLVSEANGDILLFCGVDTRFQPGSLRVMVETMLTKEKQMVSFIPKNRLSSNWNIQPLLVQPSRYAWEIALPRRLFRRPPVLSTCWLITSATLKAAGGFEATAKSISVESYFARYAVQHNDGYSFMQSGETIGLVSAKSLDEQRSTAVRVRYPQLHRRPELVAALSLAELSLLIGPFVLFIGGVITNYWLLAILGALTSALSVIFYARVTALTYRKFAIRSLWLLPIATIYDVCLLNYSMWQYEFREVIWKGRNICLPVMRTATFKLPPFDL